MSNLQPTDPKNNIEHYVSKEPFNPYLVETLTPEQECYFLATQWKLMWWKLKRHKLAVISGVFLLLMYFSAIISEVIAPYALDSRNSKYIYAPPQSIRVMHEGEFIGPFVYEYTKKLDFKMMKRNYTENTAKPQKIRFFCLGDEFNYLGLFNSRFHLFCPAEGGSLYIMGTDRLGRDSNYLVW